MARLQTPVAEGQYRLFLLALATAVGMAACTSDSAGPPEDGFLVCADVQFAQLAGLPLDEVAIGRLPADFEEPYAARMIGADGASVGLALVRIEESGDAHLIVPVHPVTPVGGGTVQLALTDGTRECTPVTFTVDPLPPAAGEFAAIVDALAVLLRDQAALLGTTPEALLATDPETLPLVYHPLALVQSILEHPDNEYSLRAIAEGSSPLSHADAITLADRLFARTELRDGLPPMQAGLAGVDGPSRVQDPDSECTPEYIGSDAARLDACMALALSVTLSTTGMADEVLDDLSKVFAALGVLPHPAIDITEAIVGLTIFVVQNQRAELAAMLPSFLADMSVDFQQTEFLEDEVGPGSWADAEVIATNEPWDMGKQVLEGALAAAGYLRTMEKFGGAEALNDLVVYWVTQGWIPWLLGDETLESFVVEAVSFGPVDVTDDEWSESRVATGDAVAFSGHQLYDLERAGTATISVRTEDGKFGGQQVAESAEITIGTLSVHISPDDVVVEPGEIAFFTVTVTNSAYPEAVSIDQSVDIQGDADITYEGESTHTVSYTAPETPNPSMPDLLTVRHTTTQGARGGDAQPRTAIATIRFGGVRITTPALCIEPGAPPLQIEAEVAGGIENPELLWTATAGTITDTGLFTPPTQAGLVTIVVALASKPLIQDELRLQVGGCSCSANISMGGESATTMDLRFRLSADRTAVESIAWRGENFSDVGFWFGPGFGPDATVIPFNTIGEFEGVTQGILNGRVFANPDDLEEPTISPLSVVLSENTGSILAGNISGAVSMAADPEPQVVSISFDFRIEEDPFLSTPDVKMCEVPPGPA